MSLFPRKPRQGDKVLQSLYDTVCQIIDFLPSLQVRGDQKTIRVNSFGTGKTIEAIKTSSSPAPTAAGESGPVYIEEGAAVPAVVDDYLNSGWDLPYSIRLYPNGFGAQTTKQTAYALPTSVSYSSPIPHGEKIIAFSSYLTDIAGQGEGEVE